METQTATAQPTPADTTPGRCPRCHGRELRRHRDTARHEIGLYNCRCGFRLQVT